MINQINMLLLGDLAACALRQEHIFTERHMFAESDERLYWKGCVEKPKIGVFYANYYHLNCHSLKHSKFINIRTG